jgi:hypothetical protein
MGPRYTRRVLSLAEFHEAGPATVDLHDLGLLQLGWREIL